MVFAVDPTLAVRTFQRLKLKYEKLLNVACFGFNCNLRPSEKVDKMTYALHRPPPEWYAGERLSSTISGHHLRGGSSGSLSGSGSSDDGGGDGGNGAAEEEVGTSADAAVPKPLRRGTLDLANWMGVRLTLWTRGKGCGLLQLAYCELFALGSGHLVLCQSAALVLLLCCLHHPTA